MRSLLISLAVLGASFSMLGCGSDPAPPADQAAGNQVDPGQKSNLGASGAGGGGGLENPGGGGSTSSAVKYPAGPYGLDLNTTVTDYTFLGLRQPLEANYDTSKTENLSFHDYYNPEADPAKPKWLMVTASARWCTFCKSEAARSMKVYDKYKGLGMEFLTVLFEDDASPPNPATLKDLQLWTKAYKLAYPVGLDPKLQLGAFFNVSAAPFNMVLDLTTMTIKFKNEGEVDLSVAGNPIEAVITGN